MTFFLKDAKRLFNAVAHWIYPILLVGAIYLPYLNVNLGLLEICALYRAGDA